MIRFVETARQSMRRLPASQRAAEAELLAARERHATSNARWTAAKIETRRLTDLADEMAARLRARRADLQALRARAVIDGDAIDARAEAAAALEVDRLADALEDLHGVRIEASRIADSRLGGQAQADFCTVDQLEIKVFALKASRDEMEFTGA